MTHRCSLLLSPHVLHQWLPALEELFLDEECATYMSQPQYCAALPRCSNPVANRLLFQDSTVSCLPLSLIHTHTYIFGQMKIPDKLYTAHTYVSIFMLYISAVCDCMCFCFSTVCRCAQTLTRGNCPPTLSCVCVCVSVFVCV